MDVEIKENELEEQLRKADLRLLRYLTIRGQNLQKLHPQAFTNLRGYRFELSITDTNIKEIPASTFHSLQKISFLRLSLNNNKIQNLHPFTYTRVPLLNQHGTILEKIDLRNNNIMCNCEFKWLRPWIEYMVENSDDIKTIEKELDEVECDAKPGIENTMLSVYGAHIPGIQSKFKATQTVDYMCKYASSSSKSIAHSISVVITITFIFS